MSIIWINTILLVVFGWFFCGILKVFVRKPYITEPEISSKFRPKFDGFIA